MAGHSHFANIVHKKGRADKKRGALFGKLSRAIMAAARRGGGDPATNLALRYAIDKARKNSMPKDNIERAIKKGCGESDGDDFSELVYEGYGAGGVAVMCDALTENRNRTAGEIRKTFEVHGGNLGNTGCVAWMFERKGLFTIPVEAIGEDDLMELALEAGADDVRRSGEYYEVTCPVDDYQQVADALESAELTTEVSEISRIPSNVVDLTDVAEGKRVLKLLEALEENEDVQSVTANFNIPDELMAEVMSED
ncbi:MAG: YebC/PmpR family DNA-binding transcriptional regulator [Maioricimonas sp. JB045]